MLLFDVGIGFPMGTILHLIISTAISSWRARWSRLRNHVVNWDLFRNYFRSRNTTRSHLRLIHCLRHIIHFDLRFLDGNFFRYCTIFRLGDIDIVWHWHLSLSRLHYCSLIIPRDRNQILLGLQPSSNPRSVDWITGSTGGGEFI